MMLLARSIHAPVLPRPHERALLAAIGLLQVGLMLGLAAVGLQYVPPGRAAVLAYTMSFWALPLGWWLAGERPRPAQVGGALLGLAGVVLFFDPRLIDWRDGPGLVGYGLILASAFCWALGACLYRRRRGWRTPFWTQTLWQLLAGSAAVAVAALALEHQRPIAWTLTLLGVLAFNWCVATALTYWWWGQVLAVMPASEAGQFVSLVPVAALFMSVLAGQDALAPQLLASVALILAGILIVNRNSRPAARPQRSGPEDGDAGRRR